MTEEQKKYYDRGFDRGFAVGVAAMAGVATLMVLALMWAAR